MNRKQRLINEFIEAGNLKEFQVIIVSIINKIYASDFVVSTRYDSCQSVTEWNSRLIRISCIKPPIIIIADIFHEYGHVLSGAPQEDISKLAREKLAWEYAFKELANYKEFHCHSDLFTEYRDFCLQSYENK